MESMNTTINFKVKDLGFFVSLAVSSLRIKNKLLHINKKYDNMGIFFVKETYYNKNLKY